jgi:hypothetical protein
MKRHKKMILGLVTSVFFLTAVSNTQGANGNPSVIPTHASFRGLSYGEWEAVWWSTALSIPVVDGSHPIINGGAFEGENGVLFFAGPSFDITIPPGTPLFVPLLNVECSVLEPDPFHGDDEASLRACANGLFDLASDHFATINGVPVKNLEDYRVESPLFEFGPLPEDNYFEFFGLDAPAGTTSLAVDAGIYLMLAPLSVGEHEIHYEGKVEAFDFEIDTTYHITVAPAAAAVPEPSTPLLFATGLLSVIGCGRCSRLRSGNRVTH